MPIMSPVTAQQSTLLIGFTRRDICVWDVRSPADPLHRLLGHHDLPATGQVKAMHRPLFVANGRYVVATGENSERLSVYDVATGKAVSRYAGDGPAASLLAPLQWKVLGDSVSNSREQHTEFVLKPHIEFRPRMAVAVRRKTPFFVKNGRRLRTRAPVST
jgi:hypothetical protein